jgi:hypothetical protein
MSVALNINNIERLQQLRIRLAKIPDYQHNGLVTSGDCHAYALRCATSLASTGAGARHRSRQTHAQAHSRVRANERRILGLKYTEYTLDWSARLRDDLPTNHPRAKSRHLRGRKTAAHIFVLAKPLCPKPLPSYKNKENEASHTPQGACCE